MIKAIIFDLGGVLVTDVFAYFDPWLASQLGVPENDVREARKKHWLDYKLGRVNGAAFVKRIIDDVGGKADARSMFEESYSFVTIKPEMTNVVADLRKTGKYKLAVLSNNGNEWSDYSRKTMRLGTFFDVWISSSKVHLKKPDAGIYLLAAKKLKVEASECVFIDNLKRNVEGAVACGMKGILFKDADRLIPELKKIGVAAR
jgi:putative hydrolase of the HAD superfamily